MSYNTTTISNVFAYLYNTLRRLYNQYAYNYSSRQYFVFANVELKRPDRIPFFFSSAGAYENRNPDGYLPTDISAYYFKERPVFFMAPELFMDSKVSGKANTYDIKSNPPFIILNLFINGIYRDVYINYDPNKLNVIMYALDAGIFVTYEQKLRDLQKVLNDVIRELSISYNQVILLQQAIAAKKYSNTSYYNKAKTKVENWISSLQKDNRYVVKVCKECNNNAQLGTVLLPITYITIAGAVSLTWLSTKFNDYANSKYYLDELLIEIERLRVELDVEWKLINNPNYKPVDSGVTPMQQATVTAKKNNNWLWLALAALGIVAVSGKGSNNKKS